MAKKFFKMHNRFAVVEFLDNTLRIYSRHKDIKDAALEAASMYSFRPCDVMQLALNDSNKDVGVIELTLSQKKKFLDGNRHLKQEQKIL